MTLTNEERNRARASAWYYANRDRAKARIKVWQQTNRDKVRSYRHLVGRVKTPEQLAARFWAKVEKTETCWLWKPTVARWWYGQVSLNKTRRLFAHRYSWEMANGPIPEGFDLLHTCDNPPCVRPDHLYVGTDADNGRDRAARGRARNQHTSGR